MEQNIIKDIATFTNPEEKITREFPNWAGDVMNISADIASKVFIIENAACFRSFPNVKNSVAIFGEGFKSRISKHIPWLAKCERTVGSIWMPPALKC